MAKQNIWVIHEIRTPEDRRYPKKGDLVRIVNYHDLGLNRTYSKMVIFQGINEEGFSGIEQGVTKKVESGWDLIYIEKDYQFIEKGWVVGSNGRIKTVQKDVENKFEEYYQRMEFSGIEVCK